MLEEHIHFQELSIMSAISQRLEQVFTGVFGDELTGKLSLSDSKDTLEEWDSLAHINLILAIEKEYKVKFSLDESLKLVSIAAIKASLEQKLGQAS